MLRIHLLLIVLTATFTASSSSSSSSVFFMNNPSYTSPNAPAIMHTSQAFIHNNYYIYPSLRPPSPVNRSSHSCLFSLLCFALLKGRVMSAASNYSLLYSSSSHYLEHKYSLTYIGRIIFTLACRLGTSERKP